MDFVFDPSLVLYLPLYQMEGASFMSKDKHGHLCTVTGAAWRLNSRYFDGSDDRISIADNDILNFTTEDFTLESWINPLTPPTSSVGSIFCRGQYLIDGYYYDVRGTPTAGIFVSTNTLGVTSIDTFSVGISWGSGWHHIVVVKLGDSVTVYKNAVAYSSAVSFQNPASSAEVPTLGEYPGNPWYRYKGWIGEHRVYNRALTPLEVQHNYLTTKWRYR